MHSSQPPESLANESARYRALLDIGRRLAGTLSRDELYAAIHSETNRVIGASGFYISLYEQEEDLATIVYYADEEERHLANVTYKGSESEVLREGTPTLVNDDLGAHSLFLLGDEDSDITRSAISAPLRYKGAVVGAISAQSYRANAFTADDLDIFSAIADLASVAVENALHVAELEKRRQEAEKIEAIGRSLASSLDPGEVLGQIIIAVTDVLSVDGAAVWMTDEPGLFRVAEAGGELGLPIGLEWDLSGPIADGLVDPRRPLVIDDLASHELVPPPLREALQAGSGMAVPLMLGGELAGALSAGSRRARHFSSDDVAVLQRLASQASVALENARLHAHLQALSLLDALTGLPNRRRLQIHLDKEVAAARRGRDLVVAIFDIDDFKQYNDTLGHLAGDEILKAFARILEDENRAMNLVARYGGDEFVSVLSESHMEGARQYAARVAERVAGDPTMGQHHVTVSTGLASFDRTTMKKMEDVLGAADRDMYKAKTAQHGQARAASN